jgi:hypothetical protein
VEQEDCPLFTNLTIEGMVWKDNFPMIEHSFSKDKKEGKKKENTPLVGPKIICINQHPYSVYSSMLI